MSTYEEFKEYVGLLVSEEEYRGQCATKIDNDLLILEWETGGVYGGSCWEDSNPVAYSIDATEPEPEFDILYLIFNVYCPEITFLEYRLLSKKIILDKRTQNEYYGNKVYFKQKKISLLDIWNFIKEKNLV